MVKALVRNKGETLTEDMDLGFVDWNNGMPFTDPEWPNGCYTLVEDYKPPEISDEIEETS